MLTLQIIESCAGHADDKKDDKTTMSIFFENYLRKS